MTVALLFGDQFDDWAKALARLALSTLTDDHQNIALKQVDSDAWANRHKAEELAPTGPSASKAGPACSPTTTPPPRPGTTRRTTLPAPPGG